MTVFKAAFMIYDATVRAHKIKEMELELDIKWSYF